MRETKELMTGMTLRSLIFGIVFSIAIILYMPFGETLGASSIVRPLVYDMRWPTGVLHGVQIYEGRSVTRAPLTPLLAIFLVPLLTSKLTKKGFSGAELAFIFSMMTPAAFYPVFNHGVGVQVLFMDFSLRTTLVATDVMTYVSPLFGPKDSAVLKPMMLGGASVPWSLWMVPLAYLIILDLSMLFFGIFGASIVRKQFIDVEALPFPNADIAHREITMGVKLEGKTSPIRSPTFLAGTLISLVYGVINIGGNFWPPFGYPEMQIDLSLYAWFTGVLGITYEPWLIGFGLFLPISVMFSCLLAYILFFMILPSVFVAAGQLAPLPTGRMTYLVWNRWIGKFEWTPYTWFRMGYIPFFMGMILAIAIWPLITHGRDLLSSLRSAIKSSKPEMAGDISDRYMWLGWGLSGLVWLVLTMVTSIPIYVSILLLAIIGVTWLSSARISAEAGAYLGPMTFLGGDGYPVIMQWTLIGTARSNPSAAYNAYMAGQNFFGSDGFWGPKGFNSTGWMLESYRVGNLTNSKNKDIFSAQILGTVLSVVIGFPLALYLVYTYGWQGRIMSWGSGNVGPIYARDVTLGNVTGPSGWQINESIPIMLAIGAIVTIAIYVLRARFGPPFTLLSPAGMVLAQHYGIYVWIPFIIALIVKILATRIGGMPFHEKHIVPLAMGLILGWAVLWIPSSIALVLRGNGYRWW